MPLDTAQDKWCTMNQATLNVAHKDGPADINTPWLAYSGTWTTGAQNPAVWPPLGSIAQWPNGIPRFANGIRLRFLVANADTEKCSATIWGKDQAGAPLNLMVLNPVTAGPSDCEIHPVSGAALTNFFYADTITIESNHCGAVLYGTGNVNGIIEVRFDLAGMSHLFCDFDFDAAAATNGTDAICLWKWW